ncbi:MAG: CHC2 zinc finger domain-containing protein [Xanthomarina gelatinilytica]|uniref:CHC2 zinc finger domain-containing protein n=1 Tax=Xanthomarina gelatinilytica TaxID=1137281 RepID=UPI003A8AC7CE
MEISEIKQRLTMANVLHYYGLKTDKQSRLNCPFHEDKTPSFQVYYKTQTAYCFSSNCPATARLHRVANLKRDIQLYLNLPQKYQRFYRVVS